MEGLISPINPDIQRELFGRRFIVVDMDGTLADSAHREHLAVAKQWDDFHAGIPDDKPHWDVHTLLEVINSGILTADVEVILLTGRNERYRKVTEAWLLKHRVKSDHLLMRPNDDWRSDHVLKPKLLVDFITGCDQDQVWTEGQLEAAKAAVWFILEDRDKVVEAWRNLGFRCWQTQPGGY